MGVLREHWWRFKLILEDLGNVAGLYDVTGQSDYPRSVVNLEQIMDAWSDDDIRTLVLSARESHGRS